MYASINVNLNQPAANDVTECKSRWEKMTLDKQTNRIGRFSMHSNTHDFNIPFDRNARNRLAVCIFCGHSILPSLWHVPFGSRCPCTRIRAPSPALFCGASGSAGNSPDNLRAQSCLAYLFCSILSHPTRAERKTVKICFWFSGRNSEAWMKEKNGKFNELCAIRILRSAQTFDASSFIQCWVVVSVRRLQ